MTQEQIAQIINDSQERIKAEVVATTIKGLSDTVSWQLQQNIKETVDLFFREEILPDLRATLTESKPQVIGAMRVSFIKVGEALGEMLLEKARKNLAESSYKSSTIAREIFG